MSFRSLVAAASCLFALSLMVPGAAAFHGAPYVVRGTATPPTGEPVWDAELRWSGAVVAGAGTYRIILAEPNTGVVVHDGRVVAKETYSNLRFEAGEGCPFLEIFDFDGEGLAGDAVFAIHGHAVANLCTGTISITVHGTYLVWTLDLST